MLNLVSRGRLATGPTRTRVNVPLSDNYLNERERNFNKVIDEFNERNAEKGLRIEAGRYGAYIALKFQTPIKKLGVFLMHTKKQQEKEKPRLTQKDDELL